jgi:hypothetical protein
MQGIYQKAAVAAQLITMNAKVIDAIVIEVERILVADLRVYGSIDNFCTGSRGANESCRSGGGRIRHQAIG